ncbi:hypothetical protein [Actinokineospora cianjurensis]|uniref:Uncharacterized protein n=1 Tax=Actinokineospora cianjurensis TaxID=585224 RepID=A0A421BC72_9PSEU|nr:hypothetical protein [Actinokineospora cianjurensis]RLK61972.1 hypothetical protein CLV68_2522 [Actinokineospora cianjurensis]
MTADLPTRLAELENQVRVAIKEHESANPAFAATRPRPDRRRRQSSTT